MDTVDAVHKFEKAGLGKAPYTYTGFEARTFQACPGAPIQVGGSCDYCYTGIINTFYFKSADGKTFKVGSDCVKKAGDAGMVKSVKRVISAQRAKAKRDKDIADLAWARENLPKAKDAFSKLPHPRGFGGMTKYDWAEWMLKNAGAAGRSEVVKEIKGVL